MLKEFKIGALKNFDMFCLEASYSLSFFSFLSAPWIVSSRAEIWLSH